MTTERVSPEAFTDFSENKNLPTEVTRQKDRREYIYLYTL